jgi:hypothetical protein
MTNNKMQCPKCKGEMVQGFVADYTMGVAALVASWHAGQPKKKLVGHTKAPRAEGANRSILMLEMRIPGVLR